MSTRGAASGDRYERDCQRREGQLAATDTRGTARGDGSVVRRPSEALAPGGLEASRAAPHDDLTTTRKPTLRQALAASRSSGEMIRMSVSVAR